MLETLEILKPALKVQELTPTYGKLSLEPLERGYGMTLGNALRRVLLSSIRGAAITAVRIDGVLHEFSTVPGVREDVIEILLNLKHIPVRSKSRDFRVLTLDTGSDEFKAKDHGGIVRAGDISLDSEVEFINPEAKICTIEEGRDGGKEAGAHLAMEFYIEQGTGYLSSERPRPQFLPVDALLTDAIFSPVLRVNYQIEAALVGQRMDYERLVLEVWTNGVISPEMAVGEAAQIIETYFGHIVASIDRSPDIKPSVAVEPEPPVDNTAEEPEAEPLIGDAEILAHPVRDLELSIRSENCLLRGGIQTIGDLLQRSRDDLLKIRNLGKISLTEIEEKLKSSGMSLRERKKI